MSTCTINTRHCEECGNTDRADLGRDGYSACCNELVVDNASWCRAFHAE